MKETRYFYVPDAANSVELPVEEAAHAVRVLRLKPGDTMVLMDGQGVFFDAEVTLATPRRCMYSIIASRPQPRQWGGHCHLVMAPTKSIERTEWAIEKATEIGIDAFTMLICDCSERRTVNAERLDKIIVAAMKQSRKPWKPSLNAIVSFRDFVAIPRNGLKFIAHCRDEVERTWLFDELRGRMGSEEITVLIGPEGDFSEDELNYALSAGYRSVHLGQSRLRTETAAVMAVAMMQLSVG